MDLIEKHEYYVYGILLALSLLIALTLTSCEEQQLKVSNNIEFSVEADLDYCIDTYVLVAIVDEADKLNWAEQFDCKGQDGSAHVDNGDLLELRVTTPGTLDKSILYVYKIYIDGVLATEEVADYTGIQLLIQ